MDYRNRASIEHGVDELVAQRIYAIALGYEDLNDHDALRDDALLWVLVGKADVTGDKRVRERDRGHALASASTLNRLELGEPGEAARSRYKRIVARPEELDELLVESHRRAPREIWLDLDATDDPVHGHQEGRFFHGYYGCYCYLPLYIFCGEHLLCARLRPSDRDASAGSVEELERIVGQLRRHWPNTRIGIRGDSGFCRESILRWCEDNGIDHVLGLARNERLVHAIGAQMRQAQAAHRRTGKAARRYRDFTLPHAKIVEPQPPCGGQGGVSDQGREPALRGDQSFHSPGRCQAPVREAVLRPRRHGEPHKRGGLCRKVPKPPVTPSALSCNLSVSQEDTGMAHKAPGKSFREGISLVQIFRMFPDDATAEAWFVARRWPTGVACPHCGSLNVQTGAKHATMPYRCREKQCAKRFSPKTGTVMEGSKLGLQVWMIATYLVSTSLKSVSSMKLHRDLTINQRSAWFLAHRLRVALTQEGGLFAGPVEVDETYMGGKRANMSKSKREELTGRGAVGKTAIAGAKDRDTNQVRAQVVERTDKPTVHGFVAAHVAPDAKVYTDDALVYETLPNPHEVVNHSAQEYVRGDVHTNGAESFWSMLKRAHKGTFHKMSPKHLDRYVQEFAARHNLRDEDTIDIMAAVITGMNGKRLRYVDLIADNGLDSGARTG